MNVNGQHWLILGLGKSGVAAANLLVSKGAQVTLWDGVDKPEFRETCAGLIDQGCSFLAGKELPGDTFDGSILSPGIPRNSKVAQKAQQQCGCMLGEIEIASRWFNGKVVAVTGTNGKSTTTELIEKVLCAGGVRAKACGNIGHPFSTVVTEGDCDVAVTEVSSFQLESIKGFHPFVAVYLNLAADHLDRYEDMRAYGEAKERIFLNQSKDDYAIVQKELELSGLKAETIQFSARNQAAEYSYSEGNIIKATEFILNTSNTQLVGPHNAENIMATLATAEVFGIASNEAIGAIQRYRPLPHRLEFIDCIDGVTFINDSKATNPDALMRALEGVEAPAILIAGGKNKGFDFRPLAGVVGESCQKVILIGESAPELNQAWGDWVTCESAESMEEAVQVAFANRSGIKTVLLSPGCASFDMFRNFENRGERFMDAVSNLKKPATRSMK